MREFSSSTNACGDEHIQQKILAIYLLVLLLGSVLSASIYFNGDAVRATSSDLVAHSLPRLEHISKLRMAMFAQKPILYEYYASLDRAKFLQRYEKNQRDIDAGLHTIRNDQDNSHLAHIMADSEMLHQLAEQLDEVLKANDVDWDRAREVLARVTTVEESIAPDIEALVQLTEDTVRDGGDQVHARTSWMTALVIGFSVVILAIALLVGYYVNAYLNEAAERKRLAMFAERNPRPVLRLAWNGDVVYGNPAAHAMVAQLHQAGLSALLPADIGERIATAQRAKRNDVRAQHDVTERVLDCELQLLADLHTCYAYVSDVTEQRRTQERLVHLAYHDSVTNLPSRRSFYETLTTWVQQRTALETGAVLLLRLDRIKLVLESQGYETSDNLLRVVAQRFGELLNRSETRDALLFRFEGATFGILLRDAVAAEPLAARLRRSMHTPFHVDDREYFFTLSVGASVYPDDGEAPHALIRNAEAAVNRVQRNGGDGYAGYTHDLFAKAEKWLDVERGLRRALERDEFVLNFQPQASLRDGRVIGVEALIRWRRDGAAFVPPLDFIPIAEETGLILPIGEWVLRSACAQTHAWHRAGHSDLVVAVNISARQFQHREFVAHVKNTLHATGLVPHALELEITESAVMHDAEKTIATLNELRALGVQLSIDDFGTGYSSLSYLKRFPLAKLKVDQSFVRNLAAHNSDAAIAQAVILLGRSLNLKVIAEGVETEQQLAWLMDAGCDEMQGYYFSKPVTANDISALLESKKSLTLPQREKLKAVN